MVKILVFETGTTAAKQIDVTQLDAALANPNATVWVDLDGRNSACETVLSSSFGLHPVVIDDIFDDNAIPKVEEFPEYLYIVVHALDSRAETPRDLHTLELDILIGPRFVITHHSDTLRSIAAVEAEVRRSPRLIQKGSAFLAHNILDHIIDHYLPLMDRFDVAIENVEGRVIKTASAGDLEELIELKHSIRGLRRLAVQQREILHRLSRGEFDLIPEASLPFYRDVHDHFAQVAELADGYRDQLNDAMVVYMSTQSHALNHVMKVLTSMSAIMMPLTFIAGVYGMNFKNMPELDTTWGYPAALGLMAVTGGALYTLFRRRGWI